MTTNLPSEEEKSLIDTLGTDEKSLIDTLGTDEKSKALLEKLKDLHDYGKRVEKIVDGGEKDTKAEKESNDTYFKIYDVKKEESVMRDIRGYASEFKIKFGLMQMGETEYKETYILEINYNSWHNHPIVKSSYSFGSMLCLDYVDECKKITEEFCQSEGLKIANELKILPNYRVVVFK